jgi:putative inorganic carbon (HCO3(-)) transporter
MLWYTPSILDQRAGCIFLNCDAASCLCWCGPTEPHALPNLLIFDPQIRRKNQVNDPIGIFVAIAICIPALIFTLQRSSWLIDYLFFVLAFNRGIRRFVDYQNGEFNPYSLISISPLIVGGLAVLVVILEFNYRRQQLGNLTLKVVSYYSVAVALAFFVGLFNAKFAAIYALGDYITPIGLIGYGAIYSNQPKVFARWCNSIAISGFVVAIYGIWQFYTIPPWDAFWVRSVDFEGYLGELEPTKMTLFSTLNERGPAASYLCNSLIILLLKPNVLTVLKPFAAPIIGFAMLLTYVRTAFIQLMIAVVVFPLINRGVGKWVILFISFVSLLFGEMAAESIPGAAKVSERLSTLSDIPNDGSFQGRLQLINYAFSESLSEPLGLGIGSHGLGSRISNIAQFGVGDSSGYVEIFRTFGWIGFALVLYVFAILWRCSVTLNSQGTFDGNVMLFRAWFVSILVACFSGNLVIQPIFFWVLAGYCLARSHDEDRDIQSVFEEDESMEYADAYS